MKYAELDEEKKKARLACLEEVEKILREGQKSIQGGGNGRRIFEQVLEKISELKKSE